MANKVTIEIDGKNANAIASINGVEKKLLDLDRIGAGVTRSMGSLGGVFSGLINPSFLLGTGITALVGGFGAMISKSIQLADDLDKLAQKTGISVESLSQLKYAAELSNTSLERLTIGLKFMSIAVLNAQMGMKMGVDAFTILKIKLEDMEGNLKTNETLLMEVADKFSKMKDGSIKTAVSVGLFGKAVAQDLIPMLNEGAQGLDEMRRAADQMGLTISTQTAKDADAFLDELERIKAMLDGLAIQSLPKVSNALMVLGFDLEMLWKGRLDVPIAHALGFDYAQTMFENFQHKVRKTGEAIRDASKDNDGIAKGMQRQNAEAERLNKSWDDISLKLKNDITLAGLTPMNALIFKHVEEAEKLLQKYQGIAGATGLIREHLLVGLTSDIFKEAKPMQQTEIGAPGDLVPNFKMEQMQFLHDQQIALAADVTTAEQLEWGLREGYAEEAFGNMAGAAQAFYEMGGKQSKTAFAMYKALSIGQAIMSTYNAAAAALVPPPIGLGPLWGPILAGSTIAMGLANVARIASMQPGSTGGGGGGMGGSSLSLPASSSINNTNNYGGSKEITINIYGFVDKDLIARELIPSLEKAWEDGVGHG